VCGGGGVMQQQNTPGCQKCHVDMELGVKSVGNMPSGSTKNGPFQVYFGLELGVRTWPERQQKKKGLFRIFWLKYWNLKYCKTAFWFRKQSKCPS